MAIERWRPFGALMDRDPFRDLQHDMNRLFDSFLGRPTAATATETAGRVWMPAVDMYETNEEFVVDFELPGIREKEVSVSITGDLLTVKGERRSDRELNGDHSLHLERAYGRFERTLELPVPVQADRVKATYRDGVLQVRLPKAEEVRPREIRIDVA